MPVLRYNWKYTSNLVNSPSIEPQTHTCTLRYGLCFSSNGRMFYIRDTSLPHARQPNRFLIVKLKTNNKIKRHTRTITWHRKKRTARKIRSFGWMTKLIEFQINNQKVSTRFFFLFQMFAGKLRSHATVAAI